MMFALRANSSSFLVRDGILKIDPTNNCTFCNTLQPYSLFHLLYECPCFLNLQSKFLSDFPTVPIDLIHTLFINVPKNKIFCLHSFLSTVYKLISSFFVDA